jgi:hypothetical protein
MTYDGTVHEQMRAARVKEADLDALLQSGNTWTAS